MPYYQFLNRGIRMHTPILTGFKMDGSLAEKLIIYFYKVLFWKLRFQYEDQFYANCLVFTANVFFL